MAKDIRQLSVSDGVKSLLLSAITIAIQKITADRPTFLFDVSDRPASFDAIVATYWDGAQRLVQDAGEDLTNFPTVEEFAELLIEEQRIFADSFEQGT